MTTTQQQQPRNPADNNGGNNIFKLRNLALIAVVLLVIINMVLQMNQFHKTFADSFVAIRSYGGSELTAATSGNDKKKEFTPIPLSELTRDDPDLICPEPLVAVHDRIVDRSSSIAKSVTPRKIPRLVHITMESRCLPPDQADTVFRWQNALPAHDVYYHDHDARERLIRDDPWPEFPLLVKLFDGCVEVGGAVTADIWRNLILYRYGGLYSDIDNWPLEAFTEDDPIMPNDSAYFFSDAANRPSQWFMSMEPYHQIAYFNMYEILGRILAMEDIADMRPVFTTGPDATKAGYLKFLSGNGENQPLSKSLHISHERYGSKRVQKGDHEGGKYIGKYYNGTKNERVPYIDEHNNTVMITRDERIKRQSGLRHWLEVVAQRRKDAKKPSGKCWDRLHYLDTLHLNNSLAEDTAVPVDGEAEK